MSFFINCSLLSSSSVLICETERRGQRENGIRNKEELTVGRERRKEEGEEEKEEIVHGEGKVKNRERM